MAEQISKPKACSGSELEELAARLEVLGLAQKQAIDTARNKPLANQFLIFGNKLCEPHQPLDKQKSTLLLRWATSVIASTQMKELSDSKKLFGAQQIMNGNLASSTQLDAALTFLSATDDDDIDEIAFKKNCGVGVKMTKSQVDQVVKSFVSAFPTAKELKWAALGKTTGELKKLEELKWANPLDLKNSVDETFLQLFGPKQAGTSSKAAPAKAKKPTKADEAGAPAASQEAIAEPSIFEMGMLSQLHKPGGNPQKDPKLIEQHLKATGGKVVTRFPPEPNGFLHIGHSKAIAINFGFAAYHQGQCILRYDDTNPEAEEQVYLDSILDIIRWLGFEPAQITYSSDHFQRLYDLAEELIKRDKAYVCFCSGAEIKANRGGEERGPRKACAHRSLPIEESLKEFRRMKAGYYPPNQITLRMKQDLEDGNPQMWDLVAYRVLEASHHRTGNEWKIYPTYDYTHCLCDSFENITHSLCTTEFIQSRVSYEWLCHALDVYTPRQTEYGRLNLEGTVMSKRKIMKLVKEGHVEGWDDPRLYTLIALRRRGIPPAAILKFVNSLGVATSVSNIPIHRFEQTVRQHLELTTPRLMMVLDPIKVVIENLAEDHLEMIERAVHPKVPEMGTVQVPFTNTIYIEREDFSLNDCEDFFRLTPTKPVGLFQVPYPIRCKTWTTDPTTGLVTEIICSYENQTKITKSNKPKAYIHWIAECQKLQSPISIEETKIYKSLFKSANPASLDNFLTDVNPNSLQIIKGSMIEIGFWDLIKKVLCSKDENNQVIDKQDVKGSGKNISNKTGFENVRFQGMRNGYFTIDKESLIDFGFLNNYDHLKNINDNNNSKLTLNWIVSLKEDSGKKNL